jgi:hypothetical protein
MSRAKYELPRDTRADVDVSFKPLTGELTEDREPRAFRGTLSNTELKMNVRW